MMPHLNEMMKFNLFMMYEKVFVKFPNLAISLKKNKSLN